MALTQTNAPYHHIDGRRINVLGFNPDNGDVRGIPLDAATLQPTGTAQWFKDADVFMDQAEEDRVNEWFDNLMLEMADAQTH